MVKNYKTILTQINDFSLLPLAQILIEIRKIMGL